MSDTIGRNIIKNHIKASAKPGDEFQYNKNSRYEKWSFNDIPLDVVPNYTYLGLTVSTGNPWWKSPKYLADQALKSLNILGRTWYTTSSCFWFFVKLKSGWIKWAKVSVNELQCRPLYAVYHCWVGFLNTLCFRITVRLFIMFIQKISKDFKVPL